MNTTAPAKKTAAKTPAVSRVKTRTERTRIKTSAPHPDLKNKCIQSEKKNQDINNIVARAHVTGHLPVLMQRQPIQQLPDSMTFQEAMDKVVHAQQSFERLPAEIRIKFDNDPKKLLKALEDPKKNLDLLKEASVIEEVNEVIHPVVQELRAQQKAENEANRKPDPTDAPKSDA